MLRGRPPLVSLGVGVWLSAEPLLRAPPPRAERLCLCVFPRRAPWRARPHPGSSRGRQRHLALGPADVCLVEQIEAGWRLLRLLAGPARRGHLEPERRGTEQGAGDRLHGLSLLCTSASPARRRGVVDLLTEGSASPWGALCCSRPRKPETQAPLRPFCARELAPWDHP